MFQKNNPNNVSDTELSPLSMFVLTQKHESSRGDLRYCLQQNLPVVTDQSLSVCARRIIPAVFFFVTFFITVF